jgi:hypothetical protein
MFSPRNQDVFKQYGSCTLYVWKRQLIGLSLSGLTTLLVQKHAITMAYGIHLVVRIDVYFDSDRRLIEAAKPLTIIK